MERKKEVEAGASMIRKNFFLFHFLLLFILEGAGFTAFARDGDGWWWREDQERVAEKAGRTQPRSAGDEAAYGALVTMDGKTVDFETFIHQKPTILVFYQGGWSPYSNSQLGDLAKLEPRLAELGYQVAAVTPDQPSKILETYKKDNVDFTLFTDKNMDIARRFGLAYRADEDVLKKMGVHLREYTGNSDETLPVPAVYGIDRKGIVQFVFFNRDYRFLADPQMLWGAAKDAISGDL